MADDSTRRPAAAAHSIICWVRRSPPCFMTLSLHDVRGFAADDLDQRGGPGHALVGHEGDVDGPADLGEPPARSVRGIGCSTRVRAYGSSRRIERRRLGEGEALVEIYPELDMRSPTAARTGGDAGDAFGGPAPDSLDLRGGEPAAQPPRWLRAAACSGGRGADPGVFSVTSWVRAPPSSEWTGRSSARAFTWRRAISMAAFALGVLRRLAIHEGEGAMEVRRGWLPIRTGASLRDGVVDVGGGQEGVAWGRIDVAPSLRRLRPW